MLARNVSRETLEQAANEIGVRATIESYPSKVATASDCDPCQPT